MTEREYAEVEKDFSASEPESLAEDGIQSLPKGHPDRDAVAAQIRKGREIDRGLNKDHWADDRNGADYIEAMEGLTATLDYVRNVVKSKTVLDIGTGSSIGINDISKSELGRRLEFKATSLTAHPEQKDNIGSENVTLTSAEVLRGIKSDSIDCVLASHSLAYSEAPRLVIQRLDQVLVEGGIIKAAFRGDDIQNSMGEKTAKEFVDELERLGYQVASKQIKAYGRTQEDLVLAKKPYANSAEEVNHIRAANLLLQDREHLFEDKLKAMEGHYSREPKKKANSETK